jgi:hypothetical protein
LVQPYKQSEQTIHLKQISIAFWRSKMTARAIFPSISPQRCSSMVTALLFLALSALFPVSRAAAQGPSTPTPDQIVFINGDKLTGTVVGEKGGVVQFQSDMTGGAIAVPWSKIKELHSSKRFAVIRADEHLKVGKPAPQVPVGSIQYSNDVVAVVPSGGEIRNIPAKDAAYLVDGADFEKALGHEPSLLHGWLGSLTLGASLVEATQKSKTFTGALDLVRLSPGVDWLAPRNKTIFDATASYGSVKQPASGTTPASSAKTDILHGDIERDWYVSQRFFALADASADHNIGSGLRIQDDFGGGAGYSVIRQAVQTLDVKGDVHYEQQQFYPAATGAPGVTLNLIGINAAEIYMRKLMHGMVLNETGLVQPAINHPSAFSAQFNAGLAFPAYKNLGFSLSTQDNYLNNPPSGYKNNTFQFTGGLNYSFK